ncbi:transferase hexapeptide repeat containing protein [Parafrankia sp. EAN1pec]|uniref:serine O-acetyltransferase n=1 Tax=Parafrankia sp. (strain EAN1pec) TaxID=298653 RepID=UPI0000540F11|nr:transferase hexapeptide repeat containing protein [Frankia sp. EAN1pec]
MSAEPRTAEPAAAGSRGAPLSLRAQLREDRDVHYGARLHPGYQALAVHRFGRWCRERGGLVGRFGTIAFKAVNNIVIRNLQGTEISVDASIGRRVLIGHHQAVMIPRHCVIGDDTIIRHGVTIGYASTDAPPDAVPKIGARVDIAPGAHLIGPITIGDDVKIGPGSIVTTDVPAGATVFAAPARIMRPPAG